MALEPPALDRIAAAVEQLVRLQSAPPPDIAHWLSRIDPEELNKAVMRRGAMSTPIMESVLTILIEWASGRG
jgi:hypothetical protein